MKGLSNLVLILVIAVVVAGGITYIQLYSKGTYQQQLVCGNGIVESGEECDNSLCLMGKVCSAKCKCEYPLIKEENFVYPALNSETVAIFVDEETYGRLSNEIEMYKQDIIKDLSSDLRDVKVKIYHRNYRFPSEVKRIIQDEWKNNNLIGVVLINNIPIKYLPLALLGAELRSQSPSDSYYTDVEGTCIEEVNETHADFMELEDPFYQGSSCPFYPRIWLGRIKPPIGGEEGLKLLKDYFDRNHDYRTGKIVYLKKLGLYAAMGTMTTEGLFENGKLSVLYGRDKYEELKTAATALFSNFSAIVGKGAKYDKEYLSMLKSPYQYVAYNGHGSYFVAQDNLSSELVKQVQPQAMFYDLQTCGNGAFDLENYIAGWYLFAGKALLVKANVETVIGPGDMPTIDTNRLILLGNGMSFGDYMLSLSSLEIGGLRPQTTLLGDPTIKFTYEKPKGNAKIKLDKGALDFGEVPINSSKEINITIYNAGDEVIDSIDTGFRRVKGWDGAVDLPPSIGIYVYPHTIRTYTISFKPEHRGEYEYFWGIIIPNSENYYVRIPIYGKGI